MAKMKQIIPYLLAGFGLLNLYWFSTKPSQDDVGRIRSMQSGVGIHYAVIAPKTPFNPVDMATNSSFFVYDSLDVRIKQIAKGSKHQFQQATNDQQRAGVLSVYHSQLSPYSEQQPRELSEVVTGLSLLALAGASYLGGRK